LAGSTITLSPLVQFLIFENGTRSCGSAHLAAFRRIFALPHQGGADFHRQAGFNSSFYETRCEEIWLAHRDLNNVLARRQRKAGLAQSLDQLTTVAVELAEGTGTRFFCGADLALIGLVAADRRAGVVGPWAGAFAPDFSQYHLPSLGWRGSFSALK
jgi:hypothetical protein